MRPDLGSRTERDADLAERARTHDPDRPDSSDWGAAHLGSSEPLTGAWAEGMAAVEEAVS